MIECIVELDPSHYDEEELEEIASEPLVRCIDCKHFVNDKAVRFCKLHRHRADWYTFCYWAEEREEDADGVQ